MQYALMLYSNETGWTAMTPEQQKQGMAAYHAFNAALQSAGAFVSTHRLQSSAIATTVRIANDKTHVLNGPFAESKEQVGGIYIIDAPDLDAALAWAARCPAAGHGVVEVRPLWPTS